MKVKQQARLSQGYTKATPACCRGCDNRLGQVCGIGGFPVRLLGFCRQWDPVGATKKEAPKS